MAEIGWGYAISPTTEGFRVGGHYYAYDRGILGMPGGWVGYGPRMGPSQDSEVIISPTGEPFSLGSFEHHKWLHRRLFHKSLCARGNNDI